VHHPGVGTLLHDAGDDVALLAAELTRTASSAMSRSRWLMTCFAAKAAMRPKSSGVVSSSPITAPSSSISGRKIATWPVLRSRTARAPSGSSPVAVVCFA